MKGIQIKGNKAVIFLDPSFYSIESVKETIENSDVGDFRIKGSDERIIVEVASEKGVESVAGEFCNNVLMTMKNKSEV